MLTIGTKVKIKESYPIYRSVRGLTGKVVWIGEFAAGNHYQIELDNPPAGYKHIISCFVEINDLEVLN